MSDVFFEELGLPEPDVNLGVGSGQPRRARPPRSDRRSSPRSWSHRRRSSSSTATSTRRSRRRSSRAKLGIPLAHVEAGLRSFDMTMPEEVNRRVTDILSRPAVRDQPRGARQPRAARASPDERMHFVGNPMIDTLLANLDRFDADAGARATHGLDGPYAVATLHRPANVDDARRRARGSWPCSTRVAAQLPVVLPLHPRGARDARARPASVRSDRLRVIEPLGYLDVPVAGPRRGGRRHRLGRHPGGDHDPRRAVPDRAPEHRAARSRSRHGTNRLVEPDGRRLAVAALARRRRRRRRPSRRRSGTATPASGSPTVIVDLARTAVEPGRGRLTGPGAARTELRFAPDATGPFRRP